MEAYKPLKEQEKKSQKWKSMKNYEDQLVDLQNCKEVKMLIDFNKNSCNSIKSLVLKKNTKVKVTSRFMNRILLMCAKISLESFV